MFESDLLDRFTRVHPAVPALVFGPAIALLALTGFERTGRGAAVALIVAGYLFWTLTEYWLHRVVFHHEPASAIGRRLHWMLHGVHHDHPNDRLRLVMPPTASIPLAAGFLALFWIALGAGPAPAFAAGFLGGYLAYDLLHFYLHHATPRTRLARRLRELHLRHHFQDHERGFGVSAPYWDHAFGTAPRSRRRATS